jgi:periplasmic divalent cation tolerance protein
MPDPRDFSGAAMVWTPFPDQSSAETVCRTLLDERLIGCANILPGVRSLFVWESECTEAEEVGVVCKTDASLLDAAIARLAALHPYETPAVIGWRCDAGTPATLAWLAELRR